MNADIRAKGEWRPNNQHDNHHPLVWNKIIMTNSLYFWTFLIFPIMRYHSFLNIWLGGGGGGVINSRETNGIVFMISRNVGQFGAFFEIF